MSLAEKQWEALQQDDTFLEGLKSGLTQRGIQPTEALLDPETETSPSGPPPFTRKASIVPQRESRGEDPSTYEQAILTLCDVRDMQVDLFKKFAAAKSFNEPMVECIRKIEQSIKSLGGSIDPFNPLAELSGLSQTASGEAAIDEQALLANALKVAENTKASYTLYSIPKIVVKVIKGKPGILLQVQGDDFMVNGQIVAQTDFLGNEAIDYVRNGDQQQFSVKALRLGKRVDVSKDYDIRNKDVTPQ